VANTRSTNAIPLVVAVCRAGLLGTSLAGESELAIACSVEAISMVTAVAWTGVQRAVISSPAGITCASEVVRRANTVSGASIGADLNRTIMTLETWVAVANTVVAESCVGAVVRAGLDGAICASPHALTVASSIEAGPVLVAVCGAFEIAAVQATETGVAVTGEVTTNTMGRAVVGACSHGAVITGPASATDASTIAARTMERALGRARLD